MSKQKTGNGILDKELEDCRRDLEIAEDLVDKARARLQREEGLILDLSNGIREKEFLIERSQESRKVALSGTDPNLVHEATEEEAKLKRELKDLVDHHESAIRTKRDLETELTRAEKKLAGADHGFWYKVMEIQKEKVKGNKDLLKSWVAFNLGGGGASFAQFLSLHFAGYSIQEAEILADELKREYGYIGR